MKKIIISLLMLPLVLAVLFALAIAVVLQQGIASKSDLLFLADLAQRQGVKAAYSVVVMDLTGVDPELISDASYGRQQVDGRGHAPWVLRGNLDGRPRVLELALAPQLWVAYDTASASLYQVWRGDVEFAGAAYDYRHGPQPVSRGESLYRDAAGARWLLDTGEGELPATVRYLGHEYRDGMRRAALRFALSAGDYRLELTEEPALVNDEGGLLLQRRFTRHDNVADVDAVFVTGDGARHLARDSIAWRLGEPVAITPPAQLDRGREVEGAELSAGATVIADGDCLGCHAPDHRVTGPSWSQIAGKYGNKVQDTVVEALAHKVLAGSVDSWGPVPMPPHPGLTEAEARAAVVFILDRPQSDDRRQVVLDQEGKPYPTTYDFDILPPPEALHPSFTAENLAPDGFEPKVGGMDFRSDGKLLLASWDADGAVFLVDPAAPPAQRVRRIAEGLHEPLGLAVVQDRLFVLQKQELTELVDEDGDEVIDRYVAVSYDWPASSNFHSFAFGLQHLDDGFYFLLSICVLPGGASCPEQLPTQGKLLRVDDSGSARVVASGFRTPNGIAIGPDGALYVTDNQGDWLPASKLIRIREGGFYGSRAVPDAGIMTRQEDPPAVWLPQDEVGNSPTEPLLLTEGPYAGQMIHGDVYNGGIKRVFLEQVDGVMQGAAFHFSGGLRGPVNRLQRGPDGAIYVGEIGNPPNWGIYGKPWYGLERLAWQGNRAFEIQSVSATPDGFELALTQPLAADAGLQADDLLVRQWFYHPDVQYGGPKYGDTRLHPTRLEVAPDRRSIRATIPGLKEGHVAYLRLDDDLRAANGDALWTAEAWYTLNRIPAAQQSAAATAPAAGGWRDLFDGESLDGWRNYGGDEGAVRKWVVDNGTLALEQEGAFPMWDLISSALFGGGSADLIYYREKFRNFELSLEWKISENGNSGIFYLVADEKEKTPWLTGVEMQVLDNDGHKDGQIVTHRAGDLYDLIAADPETVRPPGEWNEVLIRVKDNHIEHWLNGERVVSVVRGSDEWNALVTASKFNDMPRFGKADEGYIVLQDHGDPVWYRNIRVREL